MATAKNCRGVSLKVLKKSFLRRGHGPPVQYSCDGLHIYCSFMQKKAGNSVSKFFKTGLARSVLSELFNYGHSTLWMDDNDGSVPGLGFQVRCDPQFKKYAVHNF